MLIAHLWPTTRVRRLIASLVGILVVAATLEPPELGAEPLPRPQPRIVNGVLSSGYPTTGALLRGASADTATTWCSGTLIGCSTFLTAAHCVDGRSPGEFHVFLPNAGIFPVLSIAQHPSYDFPAADVAVLRLGSAVDGIAPAAIETDAAPPSGTPGVIVGYGRSGDPNFDYGLKRAGNVLTTPCTSIPPPASDITSVCWDFTGPLGTPGTNSNTCNADSGGPLFIDLGAGPRVAGITSGGSSSSCLPADRSYDASVFNYRSFIQAQGGSDITATRCGSGPQVGEVGASVLATSGTVDGTTPQGTYSFSVASGTTRLRIAMNAIDDGRSDFDLYVKAGSAPTTSVFDCARLGQNQFGVCEVTAPATGTWHVLVNRFAGAGTYQLTITQFASICTGPGSDGTSCDDSNACTSSDLCQAGACIGTPVNNGTACSDGNACTAPDTCQLGACTSSTVVDGTPCDDGDPCSRPDTCQAGACSGAAPALSCKAAAPAGALLALENRSPDTRDRLAWTWRKGSATNAIELGNPTNATAYTVCLYDSIGGITYRRLRQVIPAGSRWKAYSRGFRYRDATLSAGGLHSIVLTKGAAGRSSIQVRGKGRPLDLPGLPLSKQPNVIIQLLNDTTCWSSTHSTAQSNNPAHFRSKSD